MELNREQIVETVITEYKRLTNIDCQFIPAEACEENDAVFDECRCGFCVCILSTEKGKQSCRQFRTRLTQYAGYTQKSYISICHAGLYEMMTPLYLDGKLKGYFNVIARTESPEDGTSSAVEQLHNKYGCGTDRLLEEFQKIPAFQKKYVNPNLQLMDALLLQKTGMLSHSTAESGEGEEAKNPVVEQLPNIFFYHTYTELMDRAMNASPKAFGFVNQLQNKAFSLLFMTIQSGDIARAKEITDYIFKLALQEDTLEKQKRSAQILMNKCVDSFLLKKNYFDKAYEFTGAAIAEACYARDTAEVMIAIQNYFESLVQAYYLDNQENDPVVHRIIAFIEENYMRPFTVQQMLKELNISHSHANRVFVSQMGCSIKWYVNEYRMYQAQCMLRDTDWSVEKIALRVGYTNVRSFYKMYSKQYCLTCSEMRQFAR